MFLPYVILGSWGKTTHYMLTRQYAFYPLSTKKEIFDLVRHVPRSKGETLKSLSERIEWGSTAAVISHTLFAYPEFSNLKL